MHSTIRILWTVAVVMTSASAIADQADEAFFEKRVRPTLVQHCYECHADGADEGGLQLDSLEGLLRGGDRGPAITPGKPDESLLIRAIRHGELLKMPPKRKLTASVISDLERWIERGAIWPGAKAVTTSVSSNKSSSQKSTTKTEFSESQLRHWAFQPRTNPHVPSTVVDPWVQSPIDAFLLEKLNTVRLTPAPPADKAILIRRATIDLLGIVPTVEEVEAFVADDRPDAWPRLIDRLLASPRYGERWGRHWLDVARYADSNGLDENLAYGNAFKYRDYVVSAWNADLSFDKFIREQLAGDLLPLGNDDPAGLAVQRLIATGFLSLGAKMLAEDDPVKMQMDIIDEQLDTVGRVFLGMTFGCARCHDHKFDPVSIADYYALAGIFASTKTMETHTVVARWLERPLGSPAEIAARDASQAKIKSLHARRDEIVQREESRLLEQARRHLSDYLLAARNALEVERTLATQTPVGNDPNLAERADVLLVEAEDYARGNVIRDKKNYGKGIGVLVNRGETPNFAEYDVNIPSGGWYQFELRYAAETSRPTQLIVNGRTVKSDAASGVTGGWYPNKQQWTIEGIFELRAGPNVIRLEQPTFFPHIDKLLLAPAATGLELTSKRLHEDYEPLEIYVGRWKTYLHETPIEKLPELLKPFAPQHANLATIKESAIALDRIARELLDEKGSARTSSDAQPATDELRGLLNDTAGPFARVKELSQHFASEAADELKSIKDQEKTIEAAMPKLPEAMAVAEGPARDLKIHLRGSHLTLGDLAPRRFPAALAKRSSLIGEGASGRLELANWIAERDNPLTARVIVNRIWQWHFGNGFVRTPDNFGVLGDPPNHPQLFDWLSEEFVRSGWSIKWLHRTILLSSAYQMSTQWNEEAAALDPDNTMLWRFNRRRMEAEVLRDSLLTVSGRLDGRVGGSLLPTPNRQYVTSTANVDPVVYDSRRRSLYLPVVRSALFDVFQAFDFADPSVSQGRRETTTIAPQALFLMNSKFVSEQARALAEELLAESSDEAQRVQVLFGRAFGRKATDSEVEQALHFVAEYEKQAAAANTADANLRQSAWQSLCRAVLSTNEFVYVE